MTIFKLFYGFLKFSAIECFEVLTNKEKMLSLLKEIPRGTFNYKKFRNEFHGKTISHMDIPFEFAWQLPFLKVVTYPVGSVIYMTIAFNYVAYIYISDAIQYRLQKIKCKKSA